MRGTTFPFQTGSLGCSQLRTGTCSSRRHGVTETATFADWSDQESRAQVALVCGSDSGARRIAGVSWFSKFQMRMVSTLDALAALSASNQWRSFPSIGASPKPCNQPELKSAEFCSSRYKTTCRAQRSLYPRQRGPGFLRPPSLVTMNISLPGATPERTNALYSHCP